MKHPHWFREPADEKEWRRRRTHMAFHLSFFVFFIMAVSTLVVAGISFLLYYLKLLNFNVFSPLYVLCGMLLVSLLIGTVISAAFSKRAMTTVNYLIDALRRIGEGDFSVRVDVEKSGRMRAIAENVNLMAEELSSIETLRKDFVSNFSHEFKTPIVSIRGFAKLLKNPKLSETDRNEYLDIIFDESNRLAQLATNTLSLSKLESQEVISERRPYSVDEQLRQCVLLLESEWTKKEIDLRIDLPDITFCGNEDLLQQLWINLISNSVKFTPKGGEIAITAAFSRKNLVFTISDSGCGMSEEVKAHLFDKYYQGDESHSTPGNGLGLSIVKRIVELCGGSIEVKSRIGEGSTFVVVLPDQPLPEIEKEFAS